jgi:hypothetical protein
VTLALALQTDMTELTRPFECVFFFLEAPRYELLTWLVYWLISLDGFRMLFTSPRSRASDKAKTLCVWGAPSCCHSSSPVCSPLCKPPLCSLPKRKPGPIIVDSSLCCGQADGGRAVWDCDLSQEQPWDLTFKMSTAVFWDEMQCGLIGPGNYKRFRRTYHIHRQGNY